MIGRLRGILVEKRPPLLLVEIQGVGYEVEAPMTTVYELPPEGQEVILHTHLAVKDDGHTLYGFHSIQDRSLFRSLIRVSGVGPKLALTLLSGMRSEELLRCIRLRDTATLTRLPGVGTKTAQRLLIEMQDRLSQLDHQATPSPAEIPQAGEGNNALTEAVHALLALGYKPREAEHLLAGLNKEGFCSEELIRLALRKAVQKPPA